jgi:hypothetical protein
VVRVGGDPFRRDAQRERQVSAAAGERTHRVRFGGRPVRADHPAQQRDRLLLGHRAEGDPGVAAHRETRDALAAGDHHAAAGRRRQERLQLLGVGRVVQHHQDPPVGQHRAVQLGAGLDAGRDDVDLNAQRGEELLEHLVDHPRLRVR